jgi:hypothetical protein
MANKNKNKPVRSIPKTKVGLARELPENNNFYKYIWHIICIFIVIIFLKQYSSKGEVAGNKFSFNSFFNRVYQDQCEDNLLKKVFITDLKKIKNQYEYKFFKGINVEDFYQGKDDYIFGETMTKAYFGDDFYGENYIKEEVGKAKYVQDKLSSLGIQLLVLFAPGKNSVYTEYMPDYVLKTKKKSNNHDIYVEECQKQGVNFIDFVKYFSILKSSTQYPVFTKYGSHWSYFSECLVIDTTIKRLENLMHTHLPHIQINNIVMKDTSMVRDADIFRRLEIPVPKGNVLAYPASIGYTNAPGEKPEKILAIGDSYFRGFFYLGAMEYAFDNSQQWYYGNTIIPEDPANPEVWELDLKAEILKNKAILLMCNEMNLQTLGDNFIDQAYELFSNPEKYSVDKKEKDRINTYKKQIRNNKDLLTRLTKESQQQDIPIDTLITQEAIKLMRKS